MHIKTFPLEQTKTSIQFLVFIQIIIFDSISSIQKVDVFKFDILKNEYSFIFDKFKIEYHFNLREINWMFFQFEKNK